MQFSVRRESRNVVDDQKPYDPWSQVRSNNVKLHSYEQPKKQYVEVKIGGHPLDHLHTEYPTGGHGSSPMKVAPKVAAGLNRASVYEVHHRERMQYVEVKIGGHRYDHKRCVSVDERLVGFNDQLASIESTTLGCSLCLVQVEPLVQLYCRHALCISCFESSTHNAARVLCQVCFQKVPFLHPQMMLQKAKSTDMTLDVEKLALAVSCMGLGYAGPKVVNRVSHALRGISFGAREIVAVTESITEEKIKEIIDTDGAQRWRNRVQMVLEPSKLLRYEYIQTLGKGNFSEVMLMRRRRQNSLHKLCVLKESDKLQEAMNEVNILSKLKSPHIVQLQQYFIEQVGHLHYAYLELEYCDQGNMGEYIQTHGKLDHDMFARVMLQLCSGLTEVHKNHVVHRDLKPDNILFTSEGVIKISDFGVSTCLESALVTRHAAGTMSFMAPEVRSYFLGESVEYDWSADIWSLGAVAVALLTGLAEPKVATKPVDDIVESLERQQVPTNFIRAIAGALAPNPKSRATITQIQSWISSSYSKL